MLRLVLLAALLCGAFANSADESEEVFAGNLNCQGTGRLPEEPRALSFCYKFNDQACCAPAVDDEIAEFFTILTDVGLSCRLRNDVRDHPIAKMYCITCDPRQPRYIRNAAKPGAPANQSLLVCEDWAKRELGDLTRFDACGLLVSATCENADGESLDRNRYTCGDDLIFPSQEWDDGASDEENYEAFLNTENLGPPVLEYAYRVVKNEPCDTTAIMGSENPSCLMTAAQLVARRGDYLETGFSGTFTQDELCFNSAALAPVRLVMAIVLALVALVWAH